MTTLRYILVPLVAVMLPLVASSAHAGIIVTVGRPSPVDTTKKPKAATAFPVDANDGGGDRMCVVTLDGRTNCPQVFTIDPLTGLPMGWMCRPLGANRFYCDEPGRGAGADGEGGAGGFEEADGSANVDDVGDMDGGEEIEAFGCDAGGAGSGFGVLAALGALGAMGVRRRTARR